MNPLIIVIAGIKRSGSTVQYNLVRIALEIAGYKIIPFGHTYRTTKNPRKGECHLIKRHPFDEKIAKMADHIFLTDRPDEEIIESLAKFNGIRPGQSHVDMMRKHLDKWREYTDPFHEFTYNMIQDLDFYAFAIIDELGLGGVVGWEVANEFRKIKPPKKGKDPVTLMFDNHISDYEDNS